MASTAETISELIQELNLTPANGDLFIGNVLGFPVGLKVFANEISALLLFQIRFPANPSASTKIETNLGDQLDALIKEGTIKVEIEDNAIWLNITEGTDSKSSPADVLTELLKRLSAAGLTQTDFCHYCGREKVHKLTTFDGKVAQICEGCLQNRTERVPQSRSVLTIAPVFVFAGITVPFAAAGWVLVWIVSDAIFRWLQTSVVIVPRVIAIIGLFCVAGAVGGPPGWAIRRVPTRTPEVAAMAAATSVLLAIGIGEVAYVTWLLYREVHIISPAAALRVLPAFWRGLDFNLLIRIVAAVVGLVFACALSQPEKSKVRL